MAICVLVYLCFVCRSMSQIYIHESIFIKRKLLDVCVRVYLVCFIRRVHTGMFDVFSSVGYM